MLAKSSMWAWVVIYIVVIVFLVGQADQKYPAVILGAFAFAFVQWWLPACRPISHNWLCPWNWALGLFLRLARCLVSLAISRILRRPATSFQSQVHGLAFSACCCAHSWDSHLR